MPHTGKNKKTPQTPEQYKIKKERRSDTNAPLMVLILLFT